MALPNIDILSPIDELIARAQFGKMHRFTFYMTSGFNGFQVEKLLRQYGVRIWGRKIVEDSQRSFIVRKRQAVWAEYVMCRAGVPLVGELLDPRNAQYPDRHPESSLPTPWTEKGIPAISFIDHLGEMLAKLVQ
jgi:hypothetical protein